MRPQVKWRNRTWPIERRWGSGSMFAALAAAWMLMALAPMPAGAQGTGADPEAARILKRMTDYVGGLQRFAVDTANTVEVVLYSGQKIQFTSAARATVQRPNKLRAERIGDVVSQVFYYDGRKLAVYNPRDGYYATAAAPATIEAMVDFARETALHYSLSLPLPGTRF